MNTKLITTLRLVASALESGTLRYKWAHRESCNCGVVVAALLGLSEAQLGRSLSPYAKPLVEGKYGPTWTEMVGFHCPVTGLPAEGIFRDLLALGLTPQDIVNLEKLGDTRVLQRMGPMTVEAHSFWKGSYRKEVEIDYDNLQHLITYLRAWADLLVEEGKLDDTENTECTENTEQTERTEAA